MATRDYTLGKGKVLFKPEGQSGYIDLGNAPAFAINATIDKLEHFSSREGLSTKDLEVITKLGMGGSFTLDEPNSENLRMFVMSTAAVDAPQNSGTTAATSIANIVLDRWYPLTVTGTGTASVSASGIPEGPNTGTATLAATGTPVATANHSVKVVIKDPTATGTVGISVDNGDYVDAVLTGSSTGALDDTYGAMEGVTLTFTSITSGDIGDVFDLSITYSAATTRLSNITSLTVSGSTLNTDFVVDNAAGLFMALSTGNIAANSTVAFATTVYGANAGKVTTDGGTLTSLKGDLYFVGNPPVGRVLDIQGFCSLTPNGDFGLIGEDWMQMQFTVEFLAVTGVSGLIHVTDRGKI